MKTNYYEDLESLIKQLEEIQANGHGAFSPVQACYLLAKEIKEMKDLNTRIDAALNSYG